MKIRTPLLLGFMVISVCPSYGQVIIKDTVAISPRQGIKPEIVPLFPSNVIYTTLPCATVTYYIPFIPQSWHTLALIVGDSVKGTTICPCEAWYCYCNTPPCYGIWTIGPVPIGTPVAIEATTRSCYQCPPPCAVPLSVELVPSSGDTTYNVIIDGQSHGTVTFSTATVTQPTVQITHPAQDTTIVLSATNQPTIAFQETHTPTTGNFVPTISWDPGPVLETSEYWNQITDSLQIPIIVTAQNQCHTARDTIIVTLIKEELQLTVNSTQIRPRNTGGIDTTTVTVRAIRGGPLVGVPIHLDIYAVDSSGGHGHTTGRLTGFPGNSDGITDSNGIYRTIFFANYFGGEEWIVASSSQLPYQDSVKMTIKVPGLVLFPEDTFYVKVGGTCFHHGPRDDAQHQNCRTPDNNHRGTQQMIDSLRAGLLKFYRWSGSSKGGSQYIMLKINDMSLPLGGGFDIDGNWESSQRHLFHRLGLSVDINYQGLSTTHVKELTSIMKKKIGKRNRERPEIHYGFFGGD